MNVIITTDHLIERNESTLIIEQIIQIFPDAQIFTLAHRPENILGRIATVKVTSTFLSKICKDKVNFDKKTWLYSSAAKTLKLPENTDLVISVSNGYGHGFEIPKNAKHLIYLIYLNDLLSKTKSNFYKLLNIEVNIWRKSRLAKADSLILSAQNLLPLQDSNIIHPFIKLDDFFYDPNSKKENYYLVNLDSLTSTDLTKLITIAKSQNMNLKFFGKTRPQGVLFEDYIEVSCDGVLSHYLNECRGLIDLQNYEFPIKPLCAMAQARSVICLDTKINREYLPESLVFFIKNLDELELNWKKIDQSITAISGPHLRRHALRFNARVFKTQLMSQIKGLLHP
jgi:hypothetical protein